MKDLLKILSVVAFFMPLNAFAQEPPQQTILIQGTFQVNGLVKGDKPYLDMHQSFRKKSINYPNFEFDYLAGPSRFPEIMVLSGEKENNCLCRYRIQTKNTLGGYEVTISPYNLDESCYGNYLKIQCAVSDGAGNAAVIKPHFQTILTPK